MPPDDLKPPPDPRQDDAEAFYARYIESCQQAGVEPATREHVRELVATWDALIEATGAAKH
jgi:hypothetical protein